MPTILFTRLRGWTLAVVCAATLAGCARNPVTGKRELALISESQEIAMGKQAAEQVGQSMGLVDDEELQAYVHRLGTELAAESERPELPWQFQVIDDPTPNAFALPGGFIFVTRGLLSLINSEAELVSVLGHEIGHVTARHSVNQLSKAQLAQLGLGVGMVLAPKLQGLGQLAGAGLGLLFLKYGRDDERQADELGFKYALNEGYDVREMADVFAALQKVGEAAGSSPVPSWMSTHPDPGERIEQTQARVAALNRPLDNLTVDAAEYLTQVDGLVYGENPRQGFFQGSVFMHPDLKFKLTFPEGWKTQNTSQAVVGVSAQQDAALQLALAGQASPEEAARQFLSQQGIQPGQTSRGDINGLPAVSSYFQAETQQGVIRGLVTFVSYEGRTYQLLGYTPAQQFDQYDSVFRRAMSSFSRLDDPKALAVQPNRIEVVKLDRDMSLTEFNQRYPSVVPLPELVLINGVHSEGSVISAGTLAKQVVGAQAAGS